MLTHNDVIVGDIRTAPIGTPWDDVFADVDTIDAPADYDSAAFSFDPYVV